MDTVFVFGSNLAGRHGAGAALYAANNLGAEYGVAAGPTGKAYALPTKDKNLRVLPLSEIQLYVNNFFAYARANPDKSFLFTAVGTGLAGYKPSEIASLLPEKVPENVFISGKLW